MNYLIRKIVSNFIFAGMFIVVGYCLQWSGLATITSRVTSALQGTFVSYEWTLDMAVMIQSLYQADIWWWNTIAHMFTGWAVGGIVIVAGLYRFISIRLAALATIALMVGTFMLAAPITLSNQFVASAGGKISQGVDVVDEPVNSDAPKLPKPGDFWSGDNGGMQLAHAGFGLEWAALIFNVVRIVLIPFIMLSLAFYLVASFRRTRE
jgi:hypothetical protein